MTLISAWTAWTTGIKDELLSASADADVWTGADGSVIIDADGSMWTTGEDELTCEYTHVGTVAEYLADQELPL